MGTATGGRTVAASANTKFHKGIGTPELGPVTTGLGEIYQYVVRPKKGYEHKFDATELRTIQDWIVRRQLLGRKRRCRSKQLWWKTKTIFH